MRLLRTPMATETSALSTDEAHTTALASDAGEMAGAAVSAAPSAASVELLVVAIAGAYFFIFHRAARAANIIGGSDSALLPLGTRVRIQGLVAKPEYNGRTARITDSINESGRYAIEIEPLPAENLSNIWQPRTKLLLRPASLQRVAEQTPEPESPHKRLPQMMSAPAASKLRRLSHGEATSATASCAKATKCARAAGRRLSAVARS